MAPGSSHELACLLLTETINISVLSMKMPVYALFLDKMSAFDMARKEFILPAVFSAYGKADQSLSLIANRLSHRKTFLDNSNVILGPIEDQVGVEQGGVSSSELFLLQGSEEVITTQNSGLGINLGGVSVASIAQADDMCLLSHTVDGLQSLANISSHQTNSRCLQLVPSKSFLLAFIPNNSSLPTASSPSIQIGSSSISLSTQCEHLGVIRSSDGNMPNVLQRIAAYQAAVHGVVKAGLADRHNGSPAACLKAEAMYATPVLLSGLASLTLTEGEVGLLQASHTSTLRMLQNSLLNHQELQYIFLLVSLLSLQGYIRDS